jgi:hypothetical protein
VDHTATAFRLVDEQGQVRAQLALESGAPTLAFFDTLGRPRLALNVTADGHPQVSLHDGVSAQPQLVIEADAAGGHVLLSGNGEQKTYLFLKATGATGLVFINAAGQRQAEWMLTPEGIASWSLWDADASLQGTSSPSKGAS